MNADFKKLEDAQKELKEYSSLVGAEVEDKKNQKRLIVSEVNIHPHTWFEDGEEKVIGYDVRIFFKGSDFFIRSKEFPFYHRVK